MKKCKHPPQLTAGRLTVLTLAMMGALAAMAPTVAKAQSQTISGALTSTVLWTSGNLTAGASDSVFAPGITSSAGPGVNATGTSLGTLSNSDTISGYVGLNNSGAITALTNNSGGAIQSSRGSVSGNGISNTGNIGTLTNSGRIIAGNSIFNSGTIGVTGVNSSGIYNNGIISGYLGIFNSGSGSITTLANNSGGTIKSVTSGTSGGGGISNYGTIGTLTNSGAISSTATMTGGIAYGSGIFNGGTI